MQYKQSMQDLREIALLRWSQFGVLLCGLLLIMIGVGIHATWLRTSLLLVFSGAIAGLIYEHLLCLRGESDGFAAVLPTASGVLGMFALMTAA
jgi:hypothetical protein